MPFNKYSDLPNLYGAKASFLIFPENFIFPRVKPFFSKNLDHSLIV